MALVPLRIRNIMVRRMGLAEEPVDEFVEALDEMTDDFVPKSEWETLGMRMRSIRSRCMTNCGNSS